jgi:hypothetical protein
MPLPKRINVLLSNDKFFSILPYRYLLYLLSDRAKLVIIYSAMRNLQSGNLFLGYKKAAFRRLLELMIFTYLADNALSHYHLTSLHLVHQ